MSNEAAPQGSPQLRAALRDALEAPLAERPDTPVS